MAFVLNGGLRLSRDRVSVVDEWYAYGSCGFRISARFGREV